MGAIVIGIGVAVAALGIVLGAIGYGSAETTSGATLMTVGSTGFVGGLLLLALGFILRVLREIAEKLDGAVHFEPYEEEAAAGRADVTALVIEAEELMPAPARFPEEARAPAEPQRPESREEPAAPAGGLPSWFRRQRAEVEPELEAESAPAHEPEPAFEQPPFRPASEPARPEPARREPPPFLRQGGPGPERSGLGNIEGEPRSPEPRVPRPREEPEPEPSAPPAFLSESDLLGEEPEETPAEPEVTVLKSGTIGGMSYKLFSDGSIEADLPDGTLRFASLQDLREHVAGGGRGQS
ncbi:MAG: hypothetical protein K0S00_3746 [Xanthobacteraceae bacterium]|jgi:hypothetical protein|nr:hypothetical protein [Xanthobacteraceae bacterium]